MKIKTGDTVKVIAGKDKGKTGKVLQVLTELDKVVVEGVRPAVKHLKARGGQAGQKVEFNAPIHISNVQIVGKKVEGRVGYKMLDKDGKSVKARIVRKAGKTEDLD